MEILLSFWMIIIKKAFLSVFLSTYFPIAGGKLLFHFHWTISLLGANAMILYKLLAKL